MKNTKIAILSILLILTVITSAYTITITFGRTHISTPIQTTILSSWYTIDQDPHFNGGGYWEPDTWDESGSATHTYSMSSSKIATGLKINGYDYWGNTEYEQGTDPWYSYGSGLLYNIPANLPQRLITYSIVTKGNANWFNGRMNKYVEFWLTDGEGNWAEAMVIFDSDGIFYQPMAGENQYWATYAEGGWYFVGYRHWNMNFNQWTYRETNLNSIFNLLSTNFGCDLSEWYVYCICVGVEGTSGEMIAQWDYVYYDVGM